MRQHFNAFDGLRIFAALAVISFHYGTLVKDFTRMPHFVQNVARNGGVALPFFFLLSGFVLTHAYAGRISTSDSTRRFYLARFARIYPVYFASFILFAPMAAEKYLLHPAINEHHGLRTFLLGGGFALTLIQAWTPLSQAWNGPGWSLSAEALFYFAFPFVLTRMARMRNTTLLAGLSVIWVCMIAATVEHERHVIPQGIWHRDICYQPLFWIPMFLVGMATYRLKTLWSQVPNALASWVAAGSIVLLILLCGMPPATGGDFLVNGGAAPLLAMIVLAFSHPSSYSSRIMGAPIMVLLGGASYVIYIMQAPLWHSFRIVTDKLCHLRGTDPAADWQFLAYLAFLIGASLLTQRLIERPAQHWLIKRKKLTTTEIASHERYVGGIDVGSVKPSVTS